MVETSYFKLCFLPPVLLQILHNCFFLLIIKVSNFVPELFGLSQSTVICCYIEVEMIIASEFFFQ